MCSCSLSYPACNAHAPYNIVPRDLSGSTLFILNCLTNSTIFREKSPNTKSVLRFTLQLPSEIFLIYEEFSETLSQIHVGIHRSRRSSITEGWKLNIYVYDFASIKLCVSGIQDVVQNGYFLIASYGYHGKARPLVRFYTYKRAHPCT